MTMQALLSRRSTIFDFALILLILGLSWMTVMANQEPAPLFTLVDSGQLEAVPDMQSDLPVMRQQIVHVDPAILQRARQDISIQLFPNLNFKVTFTRLDEYENGSFAWVGVIPELDFSDVTFSVQDNILMGTVNTGERLFKIRPLGDGLHVIEEVGDHGRIDGEPIEVHSDLAPHGEDERPFDLNQTLADDGSQIDLLVVYTPQARSAAGSTAAINALIDLAVSETNTGYANSGVNHRVRLMHKQEVSYNDSGNFNADLSRLSGKSDGYMDNVHSLRDQYAADLVVLINNDTTYCGLAYLIKSSSPSAGESSGFSVVSRSCATGYYSFGHEIGHNLGSAHDRANAGTGGIFPYSYGYQDPGANFRTIMAYNCPGSCPRVNHWSNPAVTFAGLPTGVSSLSANSADNHLSLNNQAVVVANFRDSADFATPTPTATATFTPTPTFTPSPTATPSPTPLPEVNTQIFAASGGTVNTADTSLNFPGGFVNQTVNLNYKALAEGDLPATPMPPLQTTQYQFEVSGTYSSNGQPAVPQTGKTFDMSIVYSFPGTNYAAEATLNWYYWDGAQWVLATNSAVNQPFDTASADGEDFGTYALFGQPGAKNYLPFTKK